MGTGIFRREILRPIHRSVPRKVCFILVFAFFQMKIWPLVALIRPRYARTVLFR